MQNNDLISRAEAIDIIQSMTISLGGKEIFHPEAKKSVVGALDEIAAIDAEPVRQWISVKDAQPEKGVNVLFHPMCNPDSIYIGCINHVGEKGACYFEVRRGKYKTQYSATHWMPLPEPPKEDVYGKNNA